MTPSVAQAGMFDWLFGAKKVAEKKVGTVSEEKAGSNKVKSFFKKCLPIVSALAAIPLGICLFKSSGAGKSAGSITPVSPGAGKGKSLLMWGAKKLFGGALVTAGICGALFLAWKLFLRKLFDDAVDRGLGRVDNFVDAQRGKVKQDVQDAVGDVLGKANEFVDAQRGKLKHDVPAAVDDVLGQVNGFVDAQRTKTLADADKFVDAKLGKANEFVDAQRGKLKHDVPAVVGDVLGQANGFVDANMGKVDAFVDAQREKTKQDGVDAARLLPGAIVGGAASSAWNTAGRFLGGIKDGVLGFFRRKKAVSPEAETAQGDLSTEALAEDDRDLFGKNEKPRRRKKPRPSDSDKDEAEEFKSFSSGHEMIEDLVYSSDPCIDVDEVLAEETEIKEAEEEGEVAGPTHRSLRMKKRFQGDHPLEERIEIQEKSDDLCIGRDVEADFGEEIIPIRRPLPKLSLNSEDDSHRCEKVVVELAAEEGRRRVRQQHREEEEEEDR